MASYKENKTFLPVSKPNAERFEENSNGQPLFTGKIALRHNDIGEIGFSYMGGIYNTFEDIFLNSFKSNSLKVV